MAARTVERLRRWIVDTGGLPLIWVALTIAALAPIWNQRLLPQLDTANHLALVRGWHNFHDPSYHIADWYKLRVRPVPYFLFYLTIHLLLYVCQIEIANKLFLSAYVILFPLSVLALARALKRSPWLALSGFVLTFNQNWIYGFGSYLMGTCFMFLSLAWLLRWLDGGRRWTLWALGVSSILAYFGHVMPWFCFGLCAIAMLLLHVRNWRRGLWAALAMLPSVGFALAAYIEEKHDHSYFKNGEGLESLKGTWRDFPTLVMEFPRRVMELFPGNLDRDILIVVTLTIVALAIWGGVRRREDDPAQQARIKVLLIVLGLTYCLLPYKITQPMSWWYVSPRVPSMMAVLIVLWPAMRFDTPWRRMAMLPVIACAIILPLTLAHLYRDFSRRNAPFMQLVEETPRGSTVLVVVRNMMRGPGSEELSGDPVSSAPVYWHFSSWPMALHGGYDPYIFDQGIPVQPVRKLKAPPWANTDSFELRQAPEFQYYIVRDPSDEMDREPSLKVKERLGNWVLYQRIHKMTDEP
ncbi:MAG TPA: hypothetical protein VN947_18660 [Polyangia bacterium]|nr:hypothetical protein [Polyangia bacterium]